MKQIIISIILLLLTACSTPTPTTTNTPSKFSAKLPDSSEFTVYNDFGKGVIHDYDIEGRYEIQRGLYLHGEIHREITHAYIVIEKLDEDDFGYYYALKSGDTAVNSYFGIFHYSADEKKFYFKLLEGEKSTLRGGLDIVKDGDKIKLTVQMPVGKRVIIFKRAKEINIEQALILDDAMKEARENYIQVYKDRFKN